MLSINSRAKKKLTRSWQDRDWNRNRHLWHRLPVQLGKPCWILTRREDDPKKWRISETTYIGLLELQGVAAYLIDVGKHPEAVMPHDLFDTPEAATAEAERRNRT